MRGRLHSVNANIKNPYIGVIQGETAAFSCMESEKMVFCLQRMVTRPSKQLRAQPERTQAASL